MEIDEAYRFGNSEKGLSIRKQARLMSKVNPHEVERRRAMEKQTLAQRTAFELQQIAKRNRRRIIEDGG